MTFAPRSAFSEVVDEERKFTPDWYSWLDELSDLLNGLETDLGTLSTFVGFGVAATTVASLPSAATSGLGARRWVTDANATTFLSVVAGGGANLVPVVSNGTNWVIG